MRGLAFDLLRSQPNCPRVITGHTNGIVTLDIEEAGDATREQRRAAMREPYRTLLGHLRHEIGHYYWYRLIDNYRGTRPFVRHLATNEPTTRPRFSGTTTADRLRIGRMRTFPFTRARTLGKTGRKHGLTTCS